MPVIAPAVFDLIARITAATTIASAWSAYMAAAAKAGFGNGIVCFMTPGKPLFDRLIVHTLPKGWVEHCAQPGYLVENPLLERNRAASRPFEWHITDWNSSLTPQQRQWRDDATSAGMGCGLSIPNLSRGEGKVIILAGPRDDIHPHDMMTLYFVGLELLNRARELHMDPKTLALSRLSAREAECLKWVAAGKTDWEIGAILSLSEKTVNIYVERAKHKLGVPTRAQAVVMAVRSGLIRI